MPYTGFICNKCTPPIRLSREEALMHFPDQHQGVMPEAVIEAIWRGEENSRRADSHLSPSMAGGCMREYAIYRSFDMLVDPLRVWQMQEGSLFHAGLELFTPPGWLAELELPIGWIKEYDPDVLENHADQQDVPAFSLNGRSIRKVAGVWEVELFPEVWLSGKLDLLKGDYSKIIDYKTKSCPVGSRNAAGKVVYSNRIMDRSVRHDHQLQQNQYAHMVKLLWGLEDLPAMEIWQVHKGIQDSSMAWVKIEIPGMDYEVLRQELTPSYRMFTDTMERVVADKTPDPIAQMPLQGLTMFNGNKCTSYCQAKLICDGLGVPRVTVEDL